jgi:hypothetical protein
MYLFFPQFYFFNKLNSQKQHKKSNATNSQQNNPIGSVLPAATLFKSTRPSSGVSSCNGAGKAANTQRIPGKWHQRSRAQP